MFAVVGTVLAVAETSAGRLAGGVLGWLLLRSVGIRVRLASTSHLGVFRYNPYNGEIHGKSSGMEGDMTTEVSGNILGAASRDEMRGVPHGLLYQVVGYTLFGHVSDEGGYGSWFGNSEPAFQLPVWLGDVISSLGSWEGLQGEWASDGAKPVAWGMSALALRVLSEHLPAEGPAPTVGATWDGGYELSWAGSAMFISVLLDPVNGVSCSYSDDRSGREVEDEFSVDGRNDVLSELLKQFTDDAGLAATAPGREIVG